MDNNEKNENVVDNMDDKLKVCEAKRDEYLNGWKRERADFINYKKDELERVKELVGYAKEEMLLKFLPILDNLELAEKNLRDDKGIAQIRLQIIEVLKGFGAEELEVGEKFDPNVAEAVEEVEGEKPGCVIEIVQKGYTLNGRLLRPAKVKVCK